jgi:hypothetical protein
MFFGFLRIRKSIGLLESGFRKIVNRRGLTLNFLQGGDWGKNKSLIPKNVKRKYLHPGTCRVEPRCGGCRNRWFPHRFPGGPQSGFHTFLPLAPSSNRKSSFPRYGSPTTFPISLSITVVVEIPRLTELV